MTKHAPPDAIRTSSPDGASERDRAPSRDRTPEVDAHGGPVRSVLVPVVLLLLASLILVSLATGIPAPGAARRYAMQDLLRVRGELVQRYVECEALRGLPSTPEEADRMVRIDWVASRVRTGLQFPGGTCPTLTPEQLAMTDAHATFNAPMCGCTIVRSLAGHTAKPLPFIGRGE